MGAEFEPVCSLGGFTFENECVLNCVQQVQQYSGPCKRITKCPSKYRPTCGVDGLTYDNKFIMNKVGVLGLGKGECPSI